MNVAAAIAMVDSSKPEENIIVSIIPIESGKEWMMIMNHGNLGVTILRGRVRIQGPVQPNLAAA